MEEVAVTNAGEEVNRCVAVKPWTAVGIVVVIVAKEQPTSRERKYVLLFRVRVLQPRVVVVVAVFVVVCCSCPVDCFLRRTRNDRMDACD